jgi:hypothetical protein
MSALGNNTVEVFDRAQAKRSREFRVWVTRATFGTMHKRVDVSGAEDFVTAV